MDDNVTAEIAWPPVYTIKHHPRAKRVKLKASLQNGLEIIVPPRFNQKYLPDILEKNKSWIIRQLFKLQSRPPENLPDSISLLAFGQNWGVRYIHVDNKKLRLVTKPTQELVLSGDCSDKDKCIELLQRWTIKLAKLHLIVLLQRISIETQMIFKQGTIRNQKSRWGSCTSQKNISLNYKLVFLPPELVRHIIIHELSHTVCLNHSSRFWRLVASFDPLWKEHCRILRKADQWIPWWA